MKSYFLARKTLFLGLLTLLGLLLVTVLYVFYRSNDSVVDQQIEEEVKKAEVFDDLNKSLNAPAEEVPEADKLAAAMLFAETETNEVKARIDSYRVCIQIAQDLSDVSKKDNCYQSALLLTDNLQSEDDRNQWQKYLEEVYSGEISEERFDDEVQ